MAIGESKLAVAVVGGLFALGGILLTWYLSPKEVPVVVGPSVEEREFEENQRREELVASCIRTAKGRRENVDWADGLIQAVKNGNASIPGNSGVDGVCRASSFVSWQALDDAFSSTFYWIEDTDFPNAKVVCTCSK